MKCKMTFVALGAMAFGISCSRSEAPEMRMAQAELVMADEAKAGSPAASAPPARRRARPKKKLRLNKSLSAVFGEAKEEAPQVEPMEEDEGPGKGGGGPAAPTRSWFPETFLFEPAVITDASGHAELDVLVPDRLTTWRVLALAHSKAGGQAGAVTTFRSTLPIYVDPVLPPALYVGDEVTVPIQVVNTTDKPVRANLDVSVDESLSRLLQGGGPVQVPAGRSTMVPVRLRADRPGNLTFKAGIRGKDKVRRSIAIKATGRPVHFEKGGTLGGRREVTFLLPEGLEPGATRLRLQVFPGALGLLRSELGAATGRRGLAEDAYALLLAGEGPKLLENLGAKASPRAFRRMQLVAAQRVLAHARSPAAVDAAVLAEAAVAHPDNPILQRLGVRLSAQVARAQRPDGTFGGGSGWPVRRLMVATAQGVAAVRAGAVGESALQRAQVSALRASGAFERYAGRIDDPYTVAWAIASGAAQGSLRERFLKVLREAVVKDDSGARRVPAPSAARRSDGARPSDIECTAIAVLALFDDPQAKAWLPDLGATLITAYRPGRGWGDGRTNLLALRAVTKIFSEPLPKQFRLRVARQDDVWIDWKADPGYADGPWSSSQLVDGVDGLLMLTLTPEPAIPGMAYTLSIATHVPWDDEARTPGIELQIDVPKAARVGRALDVTLRAVAPAGKRITIRHALPAGVTPDPRSLSKLVVDGTVQRFDTEDGAVTLYLPARKAGQSQVVSYQVVPTLAGRLHAGASKVEAAGAETWVAPSVWTIR